MLSAGPFCLRSSQEAVPGKKEVPMSGDRGMVALCPIGMLWALPTSPCRVRLQGASAEMPWGTSPLTASQWRCLLVFCCILPACRISSPADGWRYYWRPRQKGKHSLLLREKGEESKTLLVFHHRYYTCLLLCKGTSCPGHAPFIVVSIFHHTCF